MPNRPSYVKEQQIISLANQGMNSYNIASKTGVELYWVRRIRKEYGDNAPAKERKHELEQQEEANKRWREQRSDKTKDRRERRRYADYYTDEKLSLSPRTIRQVRLVPKGKSLEILREQVGFYIKMLGWIKRVAKKLIGVKGKGNYNLYVTKYNEKYGKPDIITAKGQQVFADKIVGNFKSGIMNSEFKNIPIPFQGSHNNTTGNAKIVKSGNNYVLKVDKMQFSMVFPNENREHRKTKRNLERYKTLIEYIEEHGCPSGELMLNGQDVYYNFSLERDDQNLRQYSNGKIIIIEQFRNDQFEWFFFDETGKQLLQMTKPLANTRIKCFKNPDDYKGILQDAMAKMLYGNRNDRGIIEVLQKKFPESKPKFILCVPEQVFGIQKEWNNFKIRIPFGTLKGILCSYAYKENGEVWTNSKPFSDFEGLKTRLSL